MRFITGLFPSRASAERAARELTSAGIRRDQISIVVSEATRERDFAAPRTDTRDSSARQDARVEAEREGRDESRAGEGAAAGAAAGGVLGAVAAGLVAVAGLVAAPGVGLFVAGPFVAAIAGAAGGSVAGGMLGALVGAGMPENEAKYAAGRLLSGGILVGVHAEDPGQETVARRVLLSLGGTAVHAEMN